MVEQDKMTIIKEINSIRGEIGLEPYKMDYLDRFSRSELEELCQRQIEIKEKFEQKKPKKEFKIDSKVMVSFVVFVMFMTAIMFFAITQMYGQSVPKPEPRIEPNETEEPAVINNTKPAEPEPPKAVYVAEKITANLIYSNKSETIVRIRSLGTDNVSSLSFYLDNVPVDYSIIFGAFPLQKNQMMDINIRRVCDEASHIFEVKDSSYSYSEVLDFNCEKTSCNFCNKNSECYNLCLCNPRELGCEIYTRL